MQNIPDVTQVIHSLGFECARIKPILRTYETNDEVGQAALREQLPAALDELLSYVSGSYSTPVFRDVLLVLTRWDSLMGDAACQGAIVDFAVAAMDRAAERKNLRILGDMAQTMWPWFHDHTRQLFVQAVSAWEPQSLSDQELRVQGEILRFAGAISSKTYAQRLDGEVAVPIRVLLTLAETTREAIARGALVDANDRTMADLAQSIIYDLIFGEEDIPD